MLARALPRLGFEAMVRRRLALLVLLAGAGASVGAAIVHPRARPGDASAALDRALKRSSEEIAKKTELFEDHSTWEKAWVVDSDHYRVRTTESWILARDVGAGLDVMLDHFRTTLALRNPPPGRARIDIVPSIAMYNQLGANYDHHSSIYGAFLADRDTDRPVIAVLDRTNPTLLRMQVTHGALHQFLANAFPNRVPPTWVGEGLASYFSIYWDYSWGLARFEALRDKGELIPLRTLFGEEIAAYASAPETRFIELGMLFYYLLRFRDDTRTTQPDEATQRGPFRDWLLARLRGGAAVPEVDALLARPEVLDADFRAYDFPR